MIRLRCWRPCGSSVSGKGVDPYERQRRSAARREEATAAVLARLDPVRARAFRRLVHWAQSVAPIREDALADVGLAWPQVRRMLAEIGRRLQQAGVINEPNDVFWLHRTEIDEGLAALLIKWSSARSCGAGSGGRRRRSCCPRAAGGTCSGGGCQRHRKSRPAM